MNDDKPREKSPGSPRHSRVRGTLPVSSRSGARSSSAGPTAWLGTNPALRLGSFDSARATLLAEEPPLVGIEDFVKWTLGLPKLTRTLKKVVLDPWSFSGISDELAAHMMTSAFYASLMSDEGRWPKVALSGCNSKSNAAIALFDPPVMADAVSIAKLAHAVTPSCRLACGEIDGSPRLIGILPSIGFGLGTFATHRDGTGVPKRSLIPSFKVTIRGPGHIDVL